LMRLPLWILFGVAVTAPVRLAHSQRDSRATINSIRVRPNTAPRTANPLRRTTARPATARKKPPARTTRTKSRPPERSVPTPSPPNPTPAERIPTLEPRTPRPWTIYAASYDERKVLRYNALSGENLGDAVAKNPGLVGAHAAIPGPLNTILVSNEGNSSIRRFDASTGERLADFVSSGVGGLNNPIGICFNYDGELLVASCFTHDVKRYDGVTGAYRGAISADKILRFPVALTFGPDGNLYVLSNDQADKSPRILQFEGRTGAFQRVFVEGGGLNEARDLAFGPDGNLYVANGASHDIRVFDGKDGRSLGVHSGKDIHRWPSGIAFGPDGSMYVSEQPAPVIKRLDITKREILGSLPAAANTEKLRFVPPYSRADLTGDGLSDLVLQSASGAARVMQLNGSKVGVTANVTAAPSSDSRILGVADFNMDRRSDLVEQNLRTHEISILFMSSTGVSVQRKATVELPEPLNGEVVGAGDLDGDGWPDLAVQKEGSRDVTILIMRGARLTAKTVLTNAIAAGWRIAGAADLDGDGRADLVEQSLVTRQARFASLRGAVLEEDAKVMALPAGSAIAAVGDYDGDESPDLVLVSETTGEATILTLVNGKTAPYPLRPSLDRGWKIVGPR
jgi:hypothetical protein